MDTSMTMPTGGFVDGFRALITPDVVTKASSVFGESEASVKKGMGAALFAVFGALASKAGDRSLMSRVFDLSKDPAADAHVLSNVANLATPEASSTPTISLGSRLTSMLFGGNAESVGRALSSFAGIRPSTASTMLNLAGPMALGYIGNTVRRDGLDASGLSNMLLGQANSILRFVPNALSGVLGFAPRAADTVYRTTDTTVRKPSALRWLIPIVLAALAIWALGRLWGPRDTTTMYITRTIPGGIELQYLRNGVEGKMITFIEDPSQVAASQQWFDFDRLLFETDSARLKPESQAQIRNIAAIMKAYPNVQIKVGGYTDSSGDPAANMQLSQDRATRVMQELVELGIPASRISAEGYGPQHPVADNATEAGRALNRRVALTVTQK